ncbi:hypothetical protein F0562_005196 [Nyssa sinensis]|uniref:FHA domain-containing protein n=1 Tax=Nyssa sinensis TaxID=561372 RepID=A0A5J5ALV6_9ASTE|nr:hypothetical protein F0562_005196 [Nyssa sinensis]
MTTDMDPPPPRNPNSSITSDTTFATELQTNTLDKPSAIKAPMGPPPTKNPNPPNPDQLESQINERQEPYLNPVQNDPESTENTTGNSTTKQDVNSKPEVCPNVAVPYTIPPWGEPPCHHYFLEVLKDGSIIDQLNVYEKGAYMFGRVDLCDFVLEHPTISRFHAVLQFKRNGDAYLYDLSTHGTSINKNQVKKNVYVELHVGDVIRFGLSSRLYIFQGPSELMQPESDLKSIRKAKMREEVQDMEASLLRAKLEASLADGISWGMGEDAIEEAEDEVDEITWQTYKGQLTEKQEKTRDKIIKRLEKIANMKKEIDAIRVKDISQGGLTQGQQTQIARNEQRISQIMEELENLEETLNESIQESIGARGGKMSHGKRKGVTEDDEEEYCEVLKLHYYFLCDDDEFYDRTRKKPSNQKASDNQSIETADSLLDKKDTIIKEMEEKKKLLLDEDRMVSENGVVMEAGDALDAYMSGLSSQLVLDKTEKLQKELSTLQLELDRVLYLLNIADPTGEAARKRELKAQEPKPTLSKISKSAVVKQPPFEQNKICGSEKTVSGSIQKMGTNDMESSKLEVGEIGTDAAESKTNIYTVVKPQWLGAVEDMETKETKQQEAPLNMQEADQFVDYKDRNTILKNSDAAQVNVDSGIENAAPGLIIRKRKQVEKFDTSEVKGSEQATCSSVEAEIRAEDAVALLLKHTRGYYVSEDKTTHDSQDMPQGNESEKDNKKPKRMLGPDRPSFLDSEVDYESWVPPKGQSGDGRTSLNDRYGY